MNTHLTRSITATLFTMCIALCGHADGPEWEKISASLRAPMPETWQYQPDHVQTSPSDDKWWMQFDDPTLNRLISTAEANNYNVATALKRIEMARREVTAARASLYPTVAVSAGWTGAQSAGAVSNPVTSLHSESYFNMGASMNWEIDVFGRVAAQVKAKQAAVDVSRADYDAVMVTLAANIATAYFQLRTYQREYQVAVDHIASQEKIVNMTEVRLEAGIGDGLEVSQAKTVLYSTQSSLPGLEAAIQSTANSLAVLTGVYPSELAPTLLKDAPMPVSSGVLPVGVPMDLLRRRPDVVEAEMQLAEYAALIGVAKKDFLPVLSLSGSIGTSARKIDNLFGAHSLEYSIAPTLSWTVFDGFARKTNLAEAKLQLEAAADNYNLTLLNAVEEVENAISRYNGIVEQIKLLDKLMDESKKSYELAVDLYKQGLSDFINVVNAQLTYLENQNSLVVAKGNALTAQVALYQALGGGY